MGNATRFNFACSALQFDMKDSRIAAGGRASPHGACWRTRRRGGKLLCWGQKSQSFLFSALAETLTSSRKTITKGSQRRVGSTPIRGVIWVEKKEVETERKFNYTVWGGGASSVTPAFREKERGDEGGVVSSKDPCPEITSPQKTWIWNKRPSDANLAPSNEQGQSSIYFRKKGERENKHTADYQKKGFDLNPNEETPG